MNFLYNQKGAVSDEYHKGYFKLSTLISLKIFINDVWSLSSM